MEPPGLTGCFWDSKTSRMPDPSGRVRTFVAIPLPAAVKRFLAEIQAGLESAGMAAAWPAPDNFHLTLKFLGPVPLDILQGIQAATAELSGSYPDITLKAEGVGVFPHVRNSRVVWAGIQGRTRKLNRLVTDLDTALQSVGIPGESRPFFPHITLARLKKPVSPARMTSLIRRFEYEASPAFPVNHVVFYKSRLSPKGAVHTPLFQIRVSRFK